MARTRRDSCTTHSVIVIALTTVAVAMGLAATPARAQWQPFGNHLTTAQGEQQNPSIAPDGTGGAFVAFGGGGNSVYVQRLTGEGAIAPDWPGAMGLGIGGSGWDAAHPRAIADGVGGAFIVWDDQRHTPYCGNGCRHDPTEVYVTHMTAGGSIARGWPSDGLFTGSGMNVRSGLDHGCEPSMLLALDGRGGVFIAWTDADVRLQHVSGDGRLLWGAQGLAACPDSTDQVDPLLAADGHGGVFVSWEGRAQGAEEYRLMAQHFSYQGAPLWKRSGRPITRGTTRHEQFQRIAPGERGGFVHVWQGEVAAGRFGVFLQRVSEEGALAFEADVAVAPAAGSQQWPSLAVSKQDDAWVAWIDSRSGGNADVYAQLVTSDGTPARGMPAAGVPVWTTPNSTRWRPAVVPDERGGAYVGWCDVFILGGWSVDAWNYGVAHLSRTEGQGRVGPISGELLVMPGTFGTGALVLCPDGGHGVIGAWEEGPFPPMNPDEVMVKRISPGAGVHERPGGGRRDEGRSPSVAEGSPGFRLMGLSPDPATPGLSVEFTLPDAEPARLEIYDVAGRKVAVRDVGAMGAGTHVLDLGRASNLDAGVYFVRLSRRDGVRVARGVVMR